MMIVQCVCECGLLRKRKSLDELLSSELLRNDHTVGYCNSNVITHAHRRGHTFVLPSFVRTLSNLTHFLTSYPNLTKS